MGVLSKILANRVLLLLVLPTFAAAALFFISYAPSCLVSGEGCQLRDIRPDMARGLAVACSPLLPLCFVSGKPGNILTLIISQLLVIAALVTAGTTATYLAQTGSPLARTSLGSGFWLGLGLTLLAASDATRRITEPTSWRWLLYVQMSIFPLVLLFSGMFNDLPLLKEYANRQDVFNDVLAQHPTILFATVVPALLIGVPLGIWYAFSASRQGPVFTVLNITQTIPSVALLSLLIAPLVGLVKYFPLLGSLGVAGTGLTPALIVLMLHALLPLVCGVMAGSNQVPQDVLESIRAMGMNTFQRSVSVQFPLALPAFLRNLRVVMVQTVRMAVIAALVGTGGFGALVFQGLLGSVIDLALLGVIPVVVLAVLIDMLFDSGLAPLEVSNND